MEIENNRIASLATHVSGQGAPVENQHTGHGKAASQPAGGATGTSDRVSLTGQARQLRELETQLSSQPVVDSQRVTAVRSAVENGTFAVNPQRIAEKLISLEQALTDAR
jgi:negative regulator of flagellin synthesis FlgM